MNKPRLDISFKTEMNKPRLDILGTPESTKREPLYRVPDWWTRGGQNPTGSNGQWTLKFFLSLTMDNRPWTFFITVN